MYNNNILEEGTYIHTCVATCTAVVRSSTPCYLYRYSKYLLRIRIKQHSQLGYGPL